MDQIEQSISAIWRLGIALAEPESEVAEAKTSRLKDKIARLKQQMMQDLKAMEQRLHECQMDRAR